MIIFVKNQIIISPGEAGHHTQIGEKACAEYQCILLTRKSGNFLFKFNVYIKGAIQKSRSRTAGAELSNGLLCCLLYPGVGYQSQIRIGTKHQHLFSINYHLCILRRGNWSEKRIDSLLFKLIGKCVLCDTIV